MNVNSNKNNAQPIANLLYTQHSSIRREHREQLNQHRALVIWMTGLSGAGKSTIADALEQQLHHASRHSYILDGDNIRQGLNKDLGFSDADRVENIRRVAEVAKLMLDAGLLVISAFISPFRAERDMARELIGGDNFIEVFIDAPLAVCEARDPKGLYHKARQGKINNMTGIGSRYEAPSQPDVHINTQQVCVAQAVEQIIAAIEHKLSVTDITLPESL
jgi:bifunctional enzyme CysN/CysC